MTAENYQRMAVAASHRPRQLQFGLATMLLVVALIAVPMGLARHTILLGIMFAVAAVPALIRTCTAVARQQAIDRHDEPVGMVRLFLGSFGIVTLLAATSLATFLILLLAAALVSVITLTSWCRVCDAPLGRARGAVQWLLVKVCLVIAYIAALRHRRIRRIHMALISLPELVARLVGSCFGVCLTIGLCFVVTFVFVLRLITVGLGHVCDFSRWLLREVKRGHSNCLASTMALIRRFETT